MLNRKGSSFLKLLDYTSQEITELIDLAADFKAKKKAGIPHKLCEGKNIVLLFAKDSTRTRCAFEVRNSAHSLKYCACSWVKVSNCASSLPARWENTLDTHTAFCPCNRAISFGKSSR